MVKMLNQITPLFTDYICGAICGSFAHSVLLSLVSCICRRCRARFDSVHMDFLNKSMLSCNWLLHRQNSDSSPRKQDTAAAR